MSTQDPGGELSPRDMRRRRWGTFLCFLAQNVIVGLAYGTFGPLMPSTEAYFRISRAAAASGLGMTAAAVGAAALVVGMLCQRLPLGSVLSIGVMAAAAGFFGLAQTASYSVALAMYALIGVAFSVMAVICPVTFVNRWYRSGRGRMLGLINLPIFYIAAPVATSSLLLHFDRSTVLMIFMVGLIPLVPAMWFLPDRPADPDSAHPAAANGPSPSSQAGMVTMGMMMRSVPFWLISLGIAVIAASGTGFVAHIVPFGTGRGLTLEQAAGLVSTFTAAGVCGPMLFGWLADRIGPPYALVLTAACQTLIWLLLPGASEMQLYILSGAMGMCLTPTITLHGAALGTLFNPDQVSKAMGTSYIIKLPFLFALPSLIGLGFEQSGGYRLPFLSVAGLLAVTVLLFIALSRWGLRSQWQPA